MTKAYLNPETNIVDDPIHPCYKAPDKGLCKLRVNPPGKGHHFECANDPGLCRYIAWKEKKAVSNG
jgi:hypothetical protein